MVRPHNVRDETVIYAVLNNFFIAFVLKMWTFRMNNVYK